MKAMCHDTFEQAVVQKPSVISPEGIKRISTMPNKQRNPMDVMRTSSLEAIKQIQNSAEQKKQIRKIPKSPSLGVSQMLQRVPSNPGPIATNIFAPNNRPPNY